MKDQLTSRFAFVDQEDPRIGHIVALNYCRDCKAPENFQNHKCYPSWLHGIEKCFSCGKTFDGNTAATQVVIELDKINVDSNNHPIE